MCRYHTEAFWIMVHGLKWSMNSVSLGLDKHEWVEDIKRGESSFASFLACIEESISAREGRQFEVGLNSKVSNIHMGW